MYPDIGVSEIQTPLCRDTRYTGVWISDTPVFCILIYVCLKFRHRYILFRHRYILYPDIGVSEIQTTLCQDTRYTGVWISDNPMSGYKIYRCLNFRQAYILHPDIGLSEFQTPVYLVPRYKGVWISDTPLKYCWRIYCFVESWFDRKRKFVQTIKSCLPKTAYFLKKKHQAADFC